MDNEDFLFPEFTNTEDLAAKVLFQSLKDDIMTQEVLQLLFQSFVITLQRLVVDHLHDGI